MTKKPRGTLDALLAERTIFNMERCAMVTISYPAEGRATVNVSRRGKDLGPLTP